MAEPTKRRRNSSKQPTAAVPPAPSAPVPAAAELIEPTPDAALVAEAASAEILVPEIPVTEVPVTEVSEPEIVVPEVVVPEISEPEILVTETVAPDVAIAETPIAEPAPAAVSPAAAPVLPVLSLVETNRRNMTALVAAQRSVTQGYFALAQKQAEILRNAVETARGILSDGMGKEGGNPVEQAQSAIQTALTNMKEMAELATKANTDAITIVNGRIKESLGEFKALRKKSL